MPPLQRKEHKWTPFQKQTMLSLIVRGLHLPNHETTNRMTTDQDIKKAIEDNFCTAFNKALHGEDYNNDIDKDDIMDELKRVQTAKKHVIGPKGLVERGKSKHITRSLNASWRTNRKEDFDGSIGEWEAWRKDKVENERRKEKGLPSLQEEKDAKQAERDTFKRAIQESETQMQNRNSTIENDRGNRQYIEAAFGEHNSDEIAQLLAPKMVFSGRHAYRSGGAIAPGSIDNYIPRHRVRGLPVKAARETFTEEDFISNTGSPPISSTPVGSPFRDSNTDARHTPGQTFTNSMAADFDDGTSNSSANSGADTSSAYALAENSGVRPLSNWGVAMPKHNRTTQPFQTSINKSENIHNDGDKTLDGDGGPVGGDEEDGDEEDGDGVM